MPVSERFEKQLQFLIEVDKMKTIFRQTLLTDRSRRENDAEHSWHFALMAMLLYEYADPEKVNLTRVMKMALVHDLIEIYAGDTFAYDEKGNESKEKREHAAAQKLFTMLPKDQGQEIWSLWQEFEQMETADAQYAAALDRLQPFINNYVTQGHTWKLGNVTSDKVYQRMDAVRLGAPALWSFVEDTVRQSIEKGYLEK